MKKHSSHRLRNKKNRARTRNSLSRPQVESLEARELLAVDAFLVDTAVDENDGVGVGTGTSLREAMIAAEADPDLTTISFDPSLDGTPLITDSSTGAVASQLVINGNGAGNTIIDFNEVVGVNLAASQNIADVAGNAHPAGEPATDETYAVANAPTDPVGILQGVIDNINALGRI